MTTHPNRKSAASSRRSAAFDFSGEAAKIACEELNFRFDAHFVGVRVTENGHIVICGSAGHRHEFDALEAASRQRGWHWNRVDVRRPHQSKLSEEIAVEELEQRERFELDREMLEMGSDRQVSDADVLAYRRERDAQIQAESERRHEVDGRIQAVWPA